MSLYTCIASLLLKICVLPCIIWFLNYLKACYYFHFFTLKLACTGTDRFVSKVDTLKVSNKGF